MGEFVFLNPIRSRSKQADFGIKISRCPCFSFALSRWSAVGGECHIAARPSSPIPTGLPDHLALMGLELWRIYFAIIPIWAIPRTITWSSAVVTRILLRRTALRFSLATLVVNPMNRFASHRSFVVGLLQGAHRPLISTFAQLWALVA